MNCKIICLVVSTLIFCAAFPSTCAIEKNIENEAVEPTSFGGYFIFGFMKLIDPDESISEFEVVSKVIIIGNGETTRLNQGEMIKLHGTILGLVYNNLFIGYIGDYSIIG